jgi:peptide/nickel transport system substrate-binding protein
MVGPSLDWSDVFIPNAAQAYAAKSKDNRFWYSPTGGAVGLYLNNARAPFDNVHVRRAIGYAIDRAAISRDAEYGYEHPASSFVLQPLLPTWGDSKFTTMYPATSDLARGKEELARVHGTDLSGPVKIAVVDGWTDWVTAAEKIADRLKALNMNAIVEPLPYPTWWDRVNRGDYDTAIWTVGGPQVAPIPFDLYRQAFWSKETAPVGQPANSLNFERYRNETFDALVRSYTHTPRRREQVAVLKDMQRIIARDAPIVPIMYFATWYTFSTRRFVGWPDANHPYAVGVPYSAGSNVYVALHVHLKWGARGSETEGHQGPR